MGSRLSFMAVCTGHVQAVQGIGQALVFTCAHLAHQTKLVSNQVNQHQGHESEDPRCKQTHLPSSCRYTYMMTCREGLTSALCSSQIIARLHKPMCAGEHKAALIGCLNVHPTYDVESF